MAMVPKLIKAALNLHKALPEQVQSQGLALSKGLTGNSNFTNPPVDLNAFKVDLDTYAASIAEAKDGGKKAITLRNKQGGVVIRTIKHLATYVELNCKDDINIFLLCSAEHKRNWTKNALHWTKNALHYVLFPVMWCSMLNSLGGALSRF